MALVLRYTACQPKSRQAWVSSELASFGCFTIRISDTCYVLFSMDISPKKNITFTSVCHPLLGSVIYLIITIPNFNQLIRVARVRGKNRQTHYLRARGLSAHVACRRRDSDQAADLLFMLTPDDECHFHSRGSDDLRTLEAGYHSYFPELVISN